MYDSRFYCEFASDTFSIAFGISAAGSVIAWLGDLVALPIRERFYWLVENKSSDHDTASEFFDAQINAEFTEPPAAIRGLNSLARWNSTFDRRYGVRLYHERPLEDRIGEARRYRRVLMNNRDDFKRFVSELNEIINENTNNVDVRRFLEQKTVAVPPGTKGNKLLQLVYEVVLGDAENLIGPFFSLYDLRLWADHSIGEEKLETVAKALGVPADNYDQLFSALCMSIARSSDTLAAKIEAG